MSGRSGGNSCLYEMYISGGMGVGTILVILEQPNLFQFLSGFFLLLVPAGV
jgi:hypothetical protein